ncbi:hypothetical protein PQQ84_33640 [Paraburkholderia strydomiana]|uniref:hypothetical protein n=1 Tax=Paraburkholderia strydomiana TaxID=1245417 RepID=UPI0038BA1EF2
MQKHDGRPFALFDVMKRHTVDFDETAGRRIIAFGFAGTMSNPQCADGGGCNSRESSNGFAGYGNFFERAAHDFSSSGHRRKPIRFRRGSARCRSL